MIRAIRKKTIKLSLYMQILLYVAVLLGTTICISAALSMAGHLSLTKAASYLVFSFRPKPEAITRGDIVGKWVFDVLVIFVTAIWQAIFIFRLMFSENSLRFSTKMAFYDYDCLKQYNHREKEPHLVFRILNEEDGPIFDLEIQALLKYFDDRSSTIQHYTLNVRNHRKAILEAGNPFRIYIDVGLIQEAVDSKYLLYGDEACSNLRDGTELIGLRAGGDSEARYPKVLVIVKSYDATLDKRSIATYEYEFSKKDVVVGRFANILSIAECRMAGRSGMKTRRGWRDFYPAEVQRNFDVVAPCE